MSSTTLALIVERMDTTVSSHFTNAIDSLQQVLQVDLPDLLDGHADSFELAAVSAFASWVAATGDAMRTQLLAKTEAGFYSTAQTG